MGTSVKDFAMNNRVSLLLAPRAIVRLALNADLPAPGRAALRRGIGDAGPTIDLVVGSTAPFRMVVWIKGANVYHILVGSNGFAIVNPINNYLYTRDATYTGGAIYSDPSTVVATSWGLAAPSAAAGMDQASTMSWFAGGGYACAATAYDPDRLVESEPFFFTSATAGGITDKVQMIPGCGFSISMPELSCAAAKARFYRTRLFTIGSSTGWMPVKTSDLSHLRMIDEKATGGSPAHVDAWTDTGEQPESRLLDYCYTVVPSSVIGAYYDGRYFYAVGNKIIYSNPGCPETYAGNDYAILAEGDRDDYQGKAEFAVPADCGAITGLVVMGDTLLVLCQVGAWRVVRVSDKGLYGVSLDNLWIGCVSQATIAYSPVGVWWVAVQGIVLWTGDGAPEVITDGCLDVTDDRTKFPSLATLVGACGAYHLVDRKYVASIPGDGSTTDPFVIVVRGDRLPREVAYSVWRLRHSAGTPTGIGYDWTTDEMVYIFGTGASLAAYVHNDDYTDGAGVTYPLGLELWSGMNERPTPYRPETKHNVGLRAFIDRHCGGDARTLTVAIRGRMATDDCDGDGVIDTLTLGANEHKGFEFTPQAGVSGRMFQIVLEYEDDAAFECREVQIHYPEDLAVVGVR